MAPLRPAFTRYLWKVADGFVRHRGGVHSRDYYLNMLEDQIREAREHDAEGREHKACNELADIIVVAFEALHARGVDPERVTVERIRSRILPHIAAIERAYQGDGHKVARDDIGPDLAHAADARPGTSAAISRARAMKWLAPSECVNGCWEGVVYDGEPSPVCGVFEAMRVDPATCRWCAHHKTCHDSK